MSTLIKNCRLVSPDIDIEGASIEIVNDKISRIFTGQDKLPQADNVVDASGKTAMPGFVDIHTHGALGYDITDAKIEGLAKVAAIKPQEGVTTFLPTTLTLLEDRLAPAMKSVADYMKTPEYGKGAKIAGVHLEGPFINKNCVGAQNPAFVRKPDFDEVMRLNKIMKILIVSFAPEVEGGLEFASKLASNGFTASCAHSDATYEIFLKAKNCGVRHLTHFM